MLLWICSRYPLIPAVLVAVCGVGLISWGLVHPSGYEQHKPSHEELHQKHLTAVAELQQRGVSGNVSAVDFGDGLGLAITSNVEKGKLILTVPEALSLSVERPRSCVRPQDMTIGMWPGWAPLACKVERMVVRALARREASRLTGLLSLLVMERLAAKGAIQATAAAWEVLGVLPDVDWQSENGLFALDATELRVLGAGTSMEDWRETATNETAVAHDFMRRELDGLLGVEVSLDEVHWAYLMLHSYGQWPQANDSLVAAADGLELPSQLLFLWPLFLARPTPDAGFAATIRYNKAEQVYEVVASHDMAAGEELLFWDPRITDASALCFQGVWLTARHRSRLRLNVHAATSRDPKAQAILQKYGCGAQPLNLFVKVQRNVDPLFLSCFRMLAAADNAELLQKLERRGWMEGWPDTAPIDQRTEAAAAELAVDALQQALERLTSSNAELKQRFGGDTIAARPAVRVREAETMVVVSLLKSMRELALLSSHEYLFEALRDSQQAARRKTREQQKNAGAP